MKQDQIAAQSNHIILSPKQYPQKSFANRSTTMADTSAGQASASAMFESSYIHLGSSETSSLSDASSSTSRPLYRRTNSSVQFDDLTTVFYLEQEGSKMIRVASDLILSSNENKDEIHRQRVLKKKKAVCLHIQVLMDAQRRLKVEALRDAVLDEQTEQWAATLEDFAACSPKLVQTHSCASSDASSSRTLAEDEKDQQLAQLSRQHSMEDVSKAFGVALATELEVARS